MQPIENTPIRKPRDGNGNGDRPTGDSLSRDFHAVVADTEALLGATAQHSGEKLDEIRAKTRESLRVAKQKLEDGQQQLLSKTREAATATDTYVHSHPWTAIGAAAGAGLLLGLLLRHR